MYDTLDQVVLSVQQDVDVSEVVIISGGAKGADQLASEYALDRKFESIVMPANWSKNGRRAGYIRNEAMHHRLSSYEHRRVIAFWDGSSRGTAHNFGLAKRFNTDLIVIGFDGLRISI